MSHAKQRKETNCLNCNASVEGRFCSICGQENLEPQETTGHMISHFFNDITHFDGKFFSSLKYLLFRPGFLAKEYVAGRRAAYLNPVRMYVFTSFIFFFIFFGFIAPSNESKKSKVRTYSPKIRDSVFAALDKTKMLDSAELKMAKDDYDFRIGKRDHDSAAARTRRHKDSVSANDNSKFNIDVGDRATVYEPEYNNLEEYDSLVSSGKVHDNLLTRMFTRKELSLNERYEHDNDRISERIYDSFIHSIPQMFFLSLPLLALALKLMYIRRRKFYYAAHVIFTIHLFCFIYLSTLVTFALDAISEYRFFGWLDIVEGIIVIGMFFYWLKAIRNFYGQGWGKTILKFFLQGISLLVIIMISMFVVGLFALYKS